MLVWQMAVLFCVFGLAKKICYLQQTHRNPVLFGVFGLAKKIEHMDLLPILAVLYALIAVVVLSFY